MPKNFGQSYMKKFDINENLIGDGMGMQNFKTIAQESSSGNSLVFENVTNMP